MAPIIDEVLVDLFTLFDGEIRQEFASVRRESKMAIALAIFREFRWTVEKFGDDGRVRWQATPKLADDMGKVQKRLQEGSSDKAIRKMLNSASVRQCHPEKEAAGQYALCFGKTVRADCVGALFGLSVLIGLSVRGLIVRIVDDDGAVRWLLAPEALNRPQPLVEVDCDPDGRRLMTPTEEGFNVIFGSMTADECAVTERLLGLESGSLRKKQFN